MSQLVNRICSSRHFRRSQRLSSFLEFICTETLAGNADIICEQTIGHRVFGRAPDYDPTSDNIVRVEASQLRKRLDFYFADEGVDEPFIIRVPKGGYVPVFEPARQVEAAQPEQPVEAPVAPVAQPPSVDVSVPPAQRRYWWALLLAVATVTAGADVYLRLRRAPSAAGAVPQVNQPYPLFSAFWSNIFGERPTLFCVADSNLSLLQDLRGESISFTDYTSGRYLDSLKNKPGNSAADRIESIIASRYYTSLGDATALARLMSVNLRQAPVAVRYARDLNIRDLRSGNVVLLGSARSNPWVELLDRKLRFHIEHDTKANRPVLRDSRPNAGQPSVYLSGQQGDKPYDAYGIAAVVPNLDRTGHAVLVAGSNMQGTEAATEFLTNPARFNEFLQKIEWRTDQPMPNFEVVVKLVTVGGSPISSQVFAHSVHAE